MKKIILNGAFILMIAIVQAQSNKPIRVEVGKPCPDFIIQNITSYSKKEAVLKDFRGKWLVLDFWNKLCSACVADFPYDNKMQKELGDRMELVMIGIQDKENEIKPMYARYKNREKLEMPCAFDSLLAQRFGIASTPHSIIIDDNGVVKGITNQVTIENMEDFFAGRVPELSSTYYVKDAIRSTDIPFDGKKPFLLNGNGGIDGSFLFRSVMKEYHGELEQSVGGEIARQKNGMLQEIGVAADFLYREAYFGRARWGILDTMYKKYYRKLILEVKDPSLFQYSYQGHKKNLFSYSLIVPPGKASRSFMTKAMQNDLENYFGYDVRVEIRKCPCWRLVASNDAKVKLKTQGGESFEKSLIRRADFQLQNVPVQTLVYHIGYTTGEDVVIDDTGIVGNIDITMHCIAELDDIIRALHANGLDLVRGEKEMKCLVIRDPKSEMAQAAPNNVN